MHNFSYYDGSVYTISDIGVPFVSIFEEQINLLLCGMNTSEIDDL